MEKSKKLTHLYDMIIRHPTMREIYKHQNGKDFYRNSLEYFEYNDDEFFNEDDRCYEHMDDEEISFYICHRKKTV